MTMTSPNNTTFYRRQLPQTVVSFSSNEGRHIFSSALAHGGTRAFFALIEQLQTQPEPAYCGLTTLVIVLNGETKTVDFYHSRHSTTLSNNIYDHMQLFP